MQILWIWLQFQKLRDAEQTGLQLNMALRRRRNVLYCGTYLSELLLLKFLESFFLVQGSACNLTRCPWVAIYPIIEETNYKWRSIIRLFPDQGTDGNYKTLRKSSAGNGR